MNIWIMMMNIYEYDDNDRWWWMNIWYIDDDWYNMMNEWYNDWK